MPTRIKIKNSETKGKKPTSADLDKAELAINLADKKIYTKDQTDSIIELGGSECDPYSCQEQDLGSVTGAVTLDVTKGRTVLMNVTGNITSFNITDTTGLKVGKIDIKLTTNGSNISWNSIDDWIGAHPTTFQKGVHILILHKIDNKWYGKYEGSEIPKVAPFKMTIRTTTPSHSFTLPFSPSGAYNCQIDWDDGTPPTHITAGTGASLTHTYASPNDYQITITGNMNTISFNGNSSAPDLISIDAWGDTGLTNLSLGFKGCKNLTSVCSGNRSTTGDTWQVINMASLFQNCTSLKSVPLFDTSKATTVRTMFAGSGVITVPNFDFSRATIISSMFNGCLNLVSVPAFNFPVGTSFNSMFLGCINLMNVPLMNIPKVTDIIHAFDKCKSLQSFPPLLIPKVTNVQSAWSGCSSLISFPKMDFPATTNLVAAWNGCSSLISFPKMDFPAATNLSGAWNGCSSLISFPAIKIPNATSLSSTWFGCSSLQSFPILSIPKVTNVYSAWYQCISLQSFPRIDFKLTTNISKTWNGCTKMTDFNSYNFPLVTNALSSWSNCIALENQTPPNLPKVENLNMTWSNCINLNTTFAKLLAKMPLTQVTDMTMTFYQTLKLTGPFPMKNTSKCTNMGGTFSYSQVSSIPKLNTSKVTTFHTGALGFLSHSSKLTTLPAFDFSGITLSDAFKVFTNFSKLDTVPANLFDSVNLTTPDMSGAFNCSLTAASKNNILQSLINSGMTNGKLDIKGGEPLDGTGTTAWNTLKGKGWTGTVS